MKCLMAVFGGGRWSLEPLGECAFRDLSVEPGVAARFAARVPIPTEVLHATVATGEGRPAVLEVPGVEVGGGVGPVLAPATGAGDALDDAVFAEPAEDAGDLRWEVLHAVGLVGVGEADGSVGVPAEEALGAVRDDVVTVADGHHAALPAAETAPCVRHCGTVRGC